jgi:hypothetical protein
MTTPARCSPFLVALLVAGFFPGFVPVRANELPKDMKKIESLTPEQARKLAEEFPGVTVEIKIKGMRHVIIEGCLPLNGLRSLDAETATALTGYGKKSLLLHGLPAIDTETAKPLAASKGDWLYLDGLTTIDAATAKALADFKGTYLSLNGVTTLDADTAKALAESKSHLMSLNGLTTLDAATAKALAAFGGMRHKAFLPTTLWLSGLTTLDTDSATALAGFKGQILHLDGLTTLGMDSAKALAEFKGERLHLDGLTTPDAEVAKALAAIATWDGYLPWLKAFTAADSVAVAQALASRKGPLVLPHLKKISPKTLSALIMNEDIEIPLIERLELIPEPDGSPTEDFIIPMWLEVQQEKQRRHQAAREAE